MHRNADAALLDLRHVRREFGGVIAVEDVTFTIPRYGVTGLIGPNGAGKSTLVSMIAGAIRPSAGTVLLRGEDVTGKPPHVIARRGLTRTFQTSAVFGQLTVLENLLVGAQPTIGESVWGALLASRRWRRAESNLIARARGLLASFGLADKEGDWAETLSGGERRLVEVARALMAEPQFLLLDEPFAGVSPPMINRVLEQIVRLRDLGVTVLMAEHELGLVEQLCDTVLVMARGRVVGQGTMAELRTQRDVVGAFIG